MVVERRLIHSSTSNCNAARSTALPPRTAMSAEQVAVVTQQVQKLTQWVAVLQQRVQPNPASQPQQNQAVLTGKVSLSFPVSLSLSFPVSLSLSMFLSTNLTMRCLAWDLETNLLIFQCSFIFVIPICPDPAASCEVTKHNKEDSSADMTKNVCREDVHQENAHDCAPFLQGILSVSFVHF